MKNMCELAVPFQFSGNRLNVGDCFFYPQRFLIGFMIALFSFIFLATNIFIFLIKLRDTIQTWKNNVVESIVLFIRIGARSIYDWMKINPVNLDI